MNTEIENSIHKKIRIDISYNNFHKIIDKNLTYKFSYLDEWLLKKSKILDKESEYLEKSLKNPLNVKKQKFRTYQRGTIVKVDFGIGLGSEMPQIHFAIVINNYDNPNNNILTVIPLTSRLKYTSKRYIKGVFNYMFQYVLKNDIPVNRNYAEFVTIDDEQASNKRKRIPEKELEIILSHQSDPVADIVLTLIYTGMRANECIKIPRENINIEERYMIGGSKTEAEKNRIIPIHPRIKAVLTKRYNNCSCYLFKRDGKKYTYDTLRTDFDKFMKNLGFDYTPHDCRYTFATRAKEAHLDDNAIKKILGHAIKDVTDGIYVQWSSQLLYEEIVKIKQKFVTYRQKYNLFLMNERRNFFKQKKPTNGLFTVKTDIFKWCPGRDSNSRPIA